MRCSCVTDPKLSLRAVCWHLRWAEVFRTVWRGSSCRPWDDMQTVNKAFSYSISPVTFKASRDAASFSCNLYALTCFCSSFPHFNVLCSILFHLAAFYFCVSFLKFLLSSFLPFPFIFFPFLPLLSFPCSISYHLTLENLLSSFSHRFPSFFSSPFCTDPNWENLMFPSMHWK